MAAACQPPDAMLWTGNLATNWDDFRYGFEVYLGAADLTGCSEKRRVQILLNHIGVEGRRIYRTFVYDDAKDAENLESVLGKFEAYFKQHKNVIYERYVFFSRKQKATESFEHYLTELKTLTKTCEFDLIHDEMILLVMILGLKNDECRQRLLREPNLTLAKAVDFVKSMEAGKVQAEVMKANTSEEHQASEEVGIQAANKKEPYGKKNNSNGANPQQNEQQATPGKKKDKSCGLCGRTRKLTRTECCNNWICNDEDKYVLFSYAHNSCSRNHNRYTLCSTHFEEGHAGTWQSCKKCRDNFETEDYVYFTTNEYNFEKLQNPPSFEPTKCAECKKVIRRNYEGYTIVPKKGYVCTTCYSPLY